AKPDAILPAEEKMKSSRRFRLSRVSPTFAVRFDLLRVPCASRFAVNIQNPQTRTGSGRDAPIALGKVALPVFQGRFVGSGTRAPIADCGCFRARNQRNQFPAFARLGNYRQCRVRDHRGSVSAIQRAMILMYPMTVRRVPRSTQRTDSPQMGQIRGAGNCSQAGSTTCKRGWKSQSEQTGQSRGSRQVGSFVETETGTGVRTAVGSCARAHVELL